MNDSDIHKILASSRTIAVVGLSDKEWRDSFQVTEYLVNVGYLITPVNPNIRIVFGQQSHPDLASAGTTFDLVLVFRRPDYVPHIATQAVLIKAKTLWLQPGTYHKDALRIAREGGVVVVADRCIRVEHMVFSRMRETF